MTKINEEQKKWDLAGLSPGGPIQSGKIAVPGLIELQDERLVYKYLQGDSGWKHVETSSKLLTEFIGLADGPPERICNFARIWGVLGICEHGLPANHNPLPLPFPSIFSSEGKAWCKPLGLSESWVPYDWEPQGWEPVEAWLQFARQAMAILKIASKLYESPFNKELGDREDWETIYEYRPKNWGDSELKLDLIPIIMSNRNQAWESLSTVVNEWLFVANVRPELRWSGDRLTVSFGIYGSLFGALASQLMLAVSRTRGIAFCSDCGQLYTPKSNVRSEKKHYCLGCGRRGAMRQASKKYRSKKLN
jgi:hypothetical protein